MFDNPPPNLPTPGSNNLPAGGPPERLPIMPSPAPASPAAEPEDIFAGVEPASPQTTRPTTAVPLAEPPRQPVPRSSLPIQPSSFAQAQMPPDYMAKRQFFPWKKILIALISIAVIGGFGYAAYSYRDTIFGGLKESDTTDLNNPALNTDNLYDANAVLNENNEEPVTPDLTNEPTATAPSDNDADGLSNEQETQLGTDPDNSDTDSDKLYDAEEVNSFKTDPLKPDTDGDGFNDGDEIMNNYNPNGPGRFYTVPPVVN